MLVYLNGSVLDASEARISPLDRGFLFGDGLYEGLRAFEGHVVGLDRHIARLQGALDVLRIDWDAGEMANICDALMARSGLDDAFVYVQVTRGTPDVPTQPRSRTPPEGIRPTVFAFTAPTDGLETHRAPIVRRAITHSEIRWKYCQYKAITLLPTVLAALEASDRDADDAIFVRDGLVSEALAANVFLVNQHGVMVTPSLESAPMLEGVTRGLLLEQLDDVEVRPVEEAELRDAREIMLVGTLAMVTSISHLDGAVVGSGERAGAERLCGALCEAIVRDRAGARA